MEENHKRKHSTWRLRPNERRALIMIGDFLVSWVALAGALYFWAIAMVQDRPLLEFIQLRMETWFLLLPLVWLILLIDSYNVRTSTDMNRTLRSVSTSALIGGVIYLAIYFLSDTSLPRRGVAAFLGLVFLFTLLWRVVYIRIFSAPRFMHSVLLVGAGETGSALLRVLNQTQSPFNLVGLVDDDPEKQGEMLYGYKVLGTSKQLLLLAESNNVAEIIVAISGKMEPETFQILLEAQESGIQITRMPVSYEEILERVPVEYLEADWILRSFVDEARVSSFYSIFKRMLDIMGGLVGVASLVVLAPIISLGIFLESGRPIVFTQTRAGKGGVPFKIYKFRTMFVNEGTENLEMTKEDDQRVTAFGRILRKTHLDEWLQFFNVLRGDMSLVGPRPELPRLVDHFQKYIPFYRARLLVKPGIAGWAQIHLDYAANIEETRVKLEYDLYYIKHRHIWMDIVILLRTFASVIGFRGR